VFPISRQKLSNLGQQDVGHKGVATGRCFLAFVPTKRALALFLYLSSKIN